jgi:hypothetical protein
MATFRTVKSPRPWRVDDDGDPADVTRWGLVRCDHKHGTVSHLCCRDANSVRNIRLVAIAALEKKKRPAHLLATPPPPPPPPTPPLTKTKKTKAKTPNVKKAKDAAVSGLTAAAGAGAQTRSAQRLGVATVTDPAPRKRQRV